MPTHSPAMTSMHPSYSVSVGNKRLSLTATLSSSPKWIVSDDRPSRGDAARGADFSSYFAIPKSRDTRDSCASPAAVTPTPVSPSTTGASFAAPPFTTTSGIGTSAFPFIQRAYAQGTQIQLRPGLTSSASSPAPVPAPARSVAKAITPSGLACLLRQPKTTLLLDIRVHTQYVANHIDQSINICVPSTLLRRPAFGIDRVHDSLPPAEQEHFAAWRFADYIVVYDNEASAPLPTSGVHALLAKFERAKFSGRLLYVKGGFSAFAASQRSFLRSGEIEEGSNESAAAPAAASPRAAPVASSSKTPLACATAAPPGRTSLQVRNLPVTAFSHSSTCLAPSAQSSLLCDPCAKPEACPAETRLAANPFVDSIRQNLERLSLEHMLSGLAPLDLPPVSPNTLARLPACFQFLYGLAPLARAEFLARQFFELEYAEKERIERVLMSHSRADTDECTTKFSISSGLELGHLNRFRNVFPYEHSRVKLQQHCSSGTDYVNASYVRLPCSDRTFIASQGPLTATYCDFWQVCQQERVGVIVMLTNCQESGREKCIEYWSQLPSSRYDIECTSMECVTPEMMRGNVGSRGDVSESMNSALPRELDLRLRTSLPNNRLTTSDTGVDTPNSLPMSDADSAASSSQTSMSSAGSLGCTPEDPTKDSLVYRTLLVREKSGKHTPQKIRHFHFRGWPDFDAPAHPDEVLHLVQEVGRAQDDYLQEIGWTPECSEPQPPILVHCAAGVGRTGVFVTVSALLAGLSRAAPPPRAETDTSLSENLPKLAVFTPTDGVDLASDPLSIYACVNNLRHQRMSMISNYVQYVSAHECILNGLLKS